MPDQGNIDRFYKKSVLGRDKNLFLRVEALEAFVRALKAGAGMTSFTQNVTNIFQDNIEAILPSIAGGTSDPTDPTFTGVILSKSGQMIDGVLYHFALVENGVVITGWGDDGSTVIIGGGDVIGPESSTQGHIATFHDETGKLLSDGGSLSRLAQFASVLYLSHAANGSNKSLTRQFTEIESGSLTDSFVSGVPNDFTLFDSLGLDVGVILEGVSTFGIYLSSSVDQTVDVEVNILVTDGLTSQGVATANLHDFSLSASPVLASSWSFGNNSIGTIDADWYLQVTVSVTVSTNADITLHYGDATHPSFISIPTPVQVGSGSGLTQAQVMARMS